VLDGQKVLPETSMQHGYTHSYSNLEDALTDLLK
jgi:NAD dependent epimerase/dehydratase family enzyme